MSFIGTSLDFEDKNFSALVAAVRYSHEEFSPVWHEEASPRARCGRMMSDAIVVIGVLLLEDVQEALPADHVDPASTCVIKDIVGIADDFDRRGLLPGFGVNHQHARWSTAANQQPVMSLVQGHWVILQRGGYRPLGDKSILRQVGNLDLLPI